MAKFSYKAMTAEGKIVTNNLEATDRSAALTMIKERGMRTIWVQEGGASWQKDVNINIEPRVKTRDLSIFCRQFSTIINAGVSVLEALDILRDQTENVRLKRVVGQVFEKVQTGASLSGAMKGHKEFPNILISMVKTGEVSGNLDVVLDKIAVYFEKLGATQNKIKSALMYPIVVSVVAVLAVVILMIFVVPSFVGTFADLDIELPFITRALISVSTFMQHFWWLIAGAIAALVWMFRRWLATDRGRMKFDKFKITMFWKDFLHIAALNKKVISANFTRTMAIMLASGIPMIGALEIVGEVVNNAFVKSKLEGVIDSVSRGKGLAEPLKDVKVFPALVVHMTEIGEKTGEIEMMMDKLNVFYEDEVDTALKQLTTLIEPVILCFLAVVVGFLVLSIMMPTWSMGQMLE